ncbi:hypothetical protein [Flavobacterium wongokense]|uniref:hypothetical protein n=1 Tax=Flavobacterium wongokense TaxID=2910674 RepID=UPI001F1C6C69|nr:hypothetical protein [Flavobacterium sp. WG47]MCF6130900.1 hypothetical protein [Flavobacterium sp. WG47]
MKKLFTVLSIIACSIGYAQEIKISDLEVPTSPAFTLMDFTPTSIENPSTPQAVTLGLLNALGSNDVALEFSPYWLVSGKYKTINNYFDKEEKKAYSKPWKNLSLSIATIKKDSVQNVSAGIRTNLITINSKEKLAAITSLKAKLKAFTEKLNTDLNIAANPFAAGSAEYNKWNKAKIDEMSKDPAYIKESSAVYDANEELENLKPFLSLDVAAAYDTFFMNEFSGKANFGRFGAWATLNENITLGGEKNYICLYQYARFLVDKMTYDAASMSYTRTEDTDIGAKVELQFNRLSFGYEYIKRTKQEDNYRSVGNIKYKLTDQLVLNGGFGKNFEGSDNLVSIIGIKWGITTNNAITN